MVLDLEDIPTDDLDVGFYVDIGETNSRWAWNISYLGDEDNYTFSGNAAVFDWYAFPSVLDFYYNSSTNTIWQYTFDGDPATATVKDLLDRDNYSFKDTFESYPDKSTVTFNDEGLPEWDGVNPFNPESYSWINTLFNVAVEGPAGPEGPIGETGPQGEPGKSAFEIWFDLYGEPGDTETDFIDWLTLAGKYHGFFNMAVDLEDIRMDILTSPGHFSDIGETNSRWTWNISYLGDEDNYTFSGNAAIFDWYAFPSVLDFYYNSSTNTIWQYTFDGDPATATVEDLLDRDNYSFKDTFESYPDKSTVTFNDKRLPEWDGVNPFNPESYSWINSLFPSAITGPTGPQGPAGPQGPQGEMDMSLLQALIDELAAIKSFMGLSDVVIIQSYYSTLDPVFGMGGDSRLRGLSVSVTQSGHTFNFWGSGGLTAQTSLSNSNTYYLLTNDIIGTNPDGSAKYRYQPLSWHSGNPVVGFVWVNGVSLMLQADKNGIYFRPSSTMNNIPAGTVFQFTLTMTLVQDLEVTYDGNGADSGSVPVDNNIYHRLDSVLVQGNTGNLVRTGYTFGGWTRSDTSEVLQPDSTFMIYGENVTLRAVWVPNV